MPIETGLRSIVLVKGPTAPERPQVHRIEPTSGFRREFVHTVSAGPNGLSGFPHLLSWTGQGRTDYEFPRRLPTSITRLKVCMACCHGGFITGRNAFAKGKMSPDGGAVSLAMASPLRSLESRWSQAYYKPGTNG